MIAMCGELFPIPGGSISARHDMTPIEKISPPTEKKGVLGTVDGIAVCTWKRQRTKKNKPISASVCATGCPSPSHESGTEP